MNRQLYEQHDRICTACVVLPVNKVSNQNLVHCLSKREERNIQMGNNSVNSEKVMVLFLCISSDNASMAIAIIMACSSQEICDPCAGKTCNLQSRFLRFAGACTNEPSNGSIKSQIIAFVHVSRFSQSVLRFQFAFLRHFARARLFCSPHQNCVRRTRLCPVKTESQLYRRSPG